MFLFILMNSYSYIDFCGFQEFSTEGGGVWRVELGGYTTYCVDRSKQAQDEVWRAPSLFASRNPFKNQVIDDGVMLK